jgi:hypothetical protein
MVNGIGTMEFLFNYRYWGTGYLIGWLLGIWIFLRSGLMGILDGIVYLGIPLLYLILRAKAWWEKTNS